MRSTSPKRGAAGKRVTLLSTLAPLLRAPASAERMIKSIAPLLAVEIGQYCVIDLIDRSSTLRRVEIDHADRSRRARLRVLCEEATFPSTGRVVRLLSKGGSEIVSKVEASVRTRALADLAFLREELVRSYMATTLMIGGAPVGVITLTVTQGTRRYSADDLATLEAATEWIGLGVENAMRRERDHATSIAPPRQSGVPPRESLIVKSRA